MNIATVAVLHCGDKTRLLAQELQKLVDEIDCGTLTLGARHPDQCQTPGRRTVKGISNGRHGKTRILHTNTRRLPARIQR